MDYKEFFKNIKTGNLDNVYMVCGDEDYLLEKSIKLLKSDYKGNGFSDMNVNIFDTDSLDGRKVVESINMMPFMSDKKLVIIKSDNIFNKTNNEFKNIEEDIIKYIKNPLNSTIFIIVSKKIDKRTKIYKAFKKHSSVIELNKLDYKTLKTYVSNKINKEGKNIDIESLEFLLESFNYLNRDSKENLYGVNNELNKLIAYSNSINNKNINIEIIETILTLNIENDVFKLIDSLNNKNFKKSYERLNDLLNKGEPTLLIMVSIANHMKNLYKIKVLTEQGYSPKAIKEKTKLHPFVIKKGIVQSKNYSINNLTQNIDFILELDYKLKKGILEENLIPTLIIEKLCK